MNRQGTIAKIEGKYAWISLAPLGCCGGSGGGGCHCSSSTTEVTFQVINSQKLNLSVGDFVEVANRDAAVWGGVVRLLVIPAMLFGVGFVVWGAAIGGALAAAGLVASLLFPQNRDSGYPVIERIIPVGNFVPLAL